MDPASRDNDRSTALLATSVANPTQLVKLVADPDTGALFTTSFWFNLANVTSSVYESSHLIKGGPGRLYGLSGYNSKGSTQFIHLYDAVNLPADGAVPKVVLTVSASSNFSLDFGAYGRIFNSGIVIGNSSTGPTKTLGSVDCWFDVQYS